MEYIGQIHASLRRATPEPVGLLASLCGAPRRHGLIARESHTVHHAAKRDSLELILETIPVERESR